MKSTLRSESSAFRLEEWTIRPDDCTVTSEHAGRRLEPKVMDLLVELCRHPGEVLSKDDLLSRVWPDAFVKEVALSRGISAIRRELGDDARAPRLIETIPKRGYRLIGTVSELEVSSGSTVGPRDRTSQDRTSLDRGPESHGLQDLAEEPTGNVDKPHDRATLAQRLAQRRGGIMPVWVVALGLVAALWLMASRDEGAESISVLPLRVLGSDPELTYLADGLAEEIRSRLAVVTQLRVVSGTTSNHYRDSSLPIPEIAEQLDVQHLLEGSLQRRDRRLIIHLRLVDGRQDRQTWAKKWVLEGHELFSAQGEMAREVGSALLASFEEEKTAPSGPVVGQPSSYSLYVRARGHYRQFNPVDNARAVELLETALAQDVGRERFPLAVAALANAYALEVANFGGDPQLAEKAEQLARDALNADPNLPEAHKALGLALSQLGRPRQALHAYRKAIELRPDYDEAIHNTAFLLYQLGEWDEAGRWQPSSAPSRRPLM